MKKQLAWLLAATMAAGCLAGCGGSSAPAPAEKPAEEKAEAEAPAAEDAAPVIEEGSNKGASGETDKDVYVDFWGIWSTEKHKGEYIAQKLDEFEAIYEEQTGISVDFEYVAQDGYNGVAEKLTAGAVSGELPILSQVEDQQIAQFYPITSGDITQYISPETAENILPGLDATCSYNGKLLELPFGRSYVCLVVNETLVKQAGHTLDELGTVEGLHTVCKDIAALGDDIEGYGVYWDEDAWIWESMLYAYGGQVDNEDGTKVVFNDTSAGSEWLKVVRDMINDGSAYSAYDNYGIGDVSDVHMTMLAEGKLGVAHTSITAYGNQKNLLADGNPADVNIVLVDQPETPAGKHVVTGGSNVMITKAGTEAQKKAAGAFLDWFSQDEIVAEWADVSGYMARTKSVYESEAYAETAKDPNILQIASGIQYAHPRPTTSHWREMYVYITDKLAAFSQGGCQYTDEQIDAMVAEWADVCQAIIDDAE